MRQEKYPVGTRDSWNLYVAIVREPFSMQTEEDISHQSSKRVGYISCFLLPYACVRLLVTSFLAMFSQNPQILP